MLRRHFESAFAEALHAREVELRDGPAIPLPPQSMISPDVTCGEFVLGAIDASFDDDACALDAWDEQLVDAARHVGALVLMVDRAQRAGLLAAARGRADGAAPIIGSSEGIRAVRRRIERVAATDFTILIHGGISREAHPGFIEVFRAPAREQDDRKVAGEADAYFVHALNGESNRTFSLPPDAAARLRLGDLPPAAACALPMCRPTAGHPLSDS